ncbi:MAG: alpha/beta hydrolase family protein [Lentimicrobiaceae bacterium]|jgi:enterochelin esterase-like enzyme
MKRTSLLFFFGIILICNTVAASGLRIMESMVMSSKILNQDVHFSVCLPANYYDTKQSFPVVYLLHGLGDNEASWLEYGQISQYADKAVADGEIQSMIFVMPEAFRTYYVNDYKRSFLYQDMFVNELVPYIDSLFRTKADRQHRALMGYSMGGFGALNLHLKHLDVFGTTVPLSISVRTDEQYMTEDASGWDDQWGRLFGEPEFKGKNRITEYYKQNSPYYILSQMPSADIKKLNIYIDNGDKEQTLCRSNEELHILMRNLNIPHEFRVRDGGHSFQYWCSALPNALRFISDAFDGKLYRGDITTKSVSNMLPEKQLLTLTAGNEQVYAFVPAEYEYTSRFYPVIYLAGNFSEAQCKTIAEKVNQEIEKNLMSPILIVFLSENSVKQLTALMPEFEEKLRIRKGYRFRAIAGYQAEASDICKTAFQEQFVSCIISDAFISKDLFSGLLSDMKPKALERTSFFIDAPDKGGFYEGNGNAHMLLRDKDLQHEYRVREGKGGFDFFMAGLPEIIAFAEQRFHK